MSTSLQIADRIRKQTAHVEALKATLEQAQARIKVLEAALQPFAQNVKAVSLSKALGHITREHLLKARAALKKDAGQ
jgi:multidrug resistance efflux pump